MQLVSYFMSKLANIWFILFAKLNPVLYLKQYFRHKSKKGKVISWSSNLTLAVPLLVLLINRRELDIFCPHFKAQASEFWTRWCHSSWTFLWKYAGFWPQTFVKHITQGTPITKSGCVCQCALTCSTSNSLLSSESARLNTISVFSAPSGQRSPVLQLFSSSTVLFISSILFSAAWIKKKKNTDTEKVIVDFSYQEKSFLL